MKVNKICFVVLIVMILSQLCFSKEYSFDTRANGVLNIVDVKPSRVNLQKDITAFGGASFYMYTASLGYAHMQDGNFTLFDVAVFIGSLYGFKTSLVFARYYF